MEQDTTGGAYRMDHRPVIGPRIVRNVPRLPEQVVERFRTAYVPDVSDAVGRLYTMDSGIRPLYKPMPRLVGLALTVKAIPGDNLTIHGALQMVQPGDVLVVDWRGSTECCGTGAGSLMSPIQRGLVGAVVDGGWRDIEEVQAAGFPLFGRSISAFSPPKDQPGEINVPVSCGGVVVDAGDIVVADEEGVVVVPRAYAEQVANALREYQPKRSVGEWDIDHLTREVERRRAYYRGIFDERGGVELDWNTLHGGNGS